MAPELTALCAFPWDFADKGLDAMLGFCQELGVSHIFLAVSYHAGYFFYPDNPVRRVHLLEDGVTYFRPRPEFYRDTRLQPIAAAMCDRMDPLEEIGNRCADFELKLGAWTVCLHNTRLGLLHPECTVENALGDRYPHALCPSHPEVRAYATGLVRDLIGRVPLDLIMIEAANYRGRRHGSGWVSGHHHERDGTILQPLEQSLFDLSFASSDIAAAEAEGIDALSLQRVVRDHLLACLTAYPRRPDNRPSILAEFVGNNPMLLAYQSCFTRQTESLAGLLKAELAGTNIQLVGSGGNAYDWILAGAYDQPPSGVAAVTRAARSAAQPEQKVMVGIQLGFNPPANAAVHSQTQLEQCLTSLVENGAQGAMFYNLAESPRAELAWIKPALRQRARQIPPPRLRLGLIGCGGVGASYLAAARRVDAVAITVLADVDLEHVRQRADEHGIPTVVASTDEMLQRSDVDAVIIAVPPKWHAEILTSCLAAGKHVLVEKPLGLDLNEADRMVNAGSSSGQVVGVGLVHRYLPHYRVIRDLIVAGSLGRIRQVRVRTGRDIYPDARFTTPATARGGWLTRREIAGGGILMSSAIHLISVTSFILGEPSFLSVNAVLRQMHPRSFPGIEDDATLFVQVDGGIELMIEDSWVRPWPYELEVLGDAGHVRATGDSWVDGVILSGRLRGPLPDTYRDRGVHTDFSVNAARFADRCAPLFDGLLEDFAASALNQHVTPTLPDLPHARNVQAVVAAAYESASYRGEERPVVAHT